MTQTADFVLRRTIAFEKALKEHFGADGSGLGAMVRSLRVQLPRKLRENLLLLARERNRVVHDGIAVDLERFAKVAEEARLALNKWLQEHIKTREREKLNAWISRCPIDLDPGTRRFVLSTIQQRKLAANDGSQHSRNNSSSERTYDERRIPS